MKHSDEQIGIADVRTLAELVRRGDVSPVSIIETYLRRIDRHNPALHAFVTVCRDRASAAARECAAPPTAGSVPLRGVPYAPKDLIAVRGLWTSNGARDRRLWEQPEADATVIARLTQAGAILVGKTNLCELGMDAGAPWGCARAVNPWDPGRTVGQSSTGSAVAVAARMIPFSIGTDTSGSIRGPAARCGVVGFKSTNGAIPLDGVLPLSWTLDTIGIVATSAADVALVLSAIGDRPRGQPDETLSAADGLHQIRLGVPRHYFFDRLSPPVVSALRSAVDAFKSLGATLVDVDVPSAAKSDYATAVIGLTEAACVHESRIEQHRRALHPRTRHYLDTAMKYRATEYARALQTRDQLRREMGKVFSACDVMLTPTLRRLPERVRLRGRPVRHASNTSLANLVGCPAIACPCGFSRSSRPLPVSIQLLARPTADAMLLRVAHAFQLTTAWHTSRPRAYD